MTPSLTISTDQLNAYLYRRQGFDLAKVGSLEDLAAAPVGIYGTGPSLYPSLLARFAGLTIADVSAALYDRRDLVRLRAMRGSLFAVPSGLLPVVFQATKRQAGAAFSSLVSRYGVSEDEYEAVAARVETLLAARPMTKAELGRALPDLNEPARRGLSAIVARMGGQGRVLRGRVRGTWKSDQTEFVRVVDWLPGVDLDAMTPEEAAAALARLYFESYGPATAADFRWWSGLNAPETEAALAAVLPELEGVTVEGLPGDYLLTPARVETLRSAALVGEAETALLPVWDAYLMAYRERGRYLAAEWYDRIYDAAGNATYTVLAGGCVAGVWAMSEEKSVFTALVGLFAPAGPDVWRSIGAAAERLAEQIGAARGKLFAEVRLVDAGPPPSLLDDASQNRFRSPLG